MSEPNIVDQGDWLAALRARVEKNASTAASLFSELSREQLCWKPDAKSWSVVEVFSHVLETGLPYEKKLDGAIEQATARAKAQGRPGRFQPGLLGRFFLKLMYSDKRRLKAPPSFHPKTSDYDEEMPSRFADYTSRLIEQLKRAEGAALAQKFSSPISRLIRFQLGVGLELMVAHQERHLRQIERLRARDEFPKHADG